MNRSALFLSVGVLLLASACAKQQAASTAPATDALPPAEQALPPSDSAAPSTPDATTSAPGTTTSPTDATTAPPSEPQTQDPSSSTTPKE